MQERVGWQRVLGVARFRGSRSETNLRLASLVLLTIQPVLKAKTELMPGPADHGHH